MTEELEILSRSKVQEFIKGKMGEWQEGDWFSTGHIIRIVTELSIDNFVTSFHECFDKNEIIHIPLAIPLPGQPKERTLWGMIDGWKRLSSNNSQSTLEIEGSREYSADTPYLALLKALVAQEGLEP